MTFHINKILLSWSKVNLIPLQKIHVVEHMLQIKIKSYLVGFFRGI